MKKTIEIRAFPMYLGGVTIELDGRYVVASGLNTMEALVTLAGLLESGPQRVKLTMPEVSSSFKGHYENGREAMATSDCCRCCLKKKKKK